MFKLMTSAATGILAMAALTACGPSSGASSVAGDCTPAHGGLDTVRPGTLSVATYNFPPFVKIVGTQASGVEGGLLAKVAKMECLSLTAQPLDTGSVISSTESGRTDIAAGNWYCTAARAAKLTLVGPVYFDKLGIVSQDGVDTFDKLKGRTIGTVDGYNYNAELQALFGSDVKVYPTPTAMYTDLKSGRLAAALDSFGSASYANEQNGRAWKVIVPQPDERVAPSKEPSQVCFPMAKGKSKLYEAIQADIETLRRDGTIASILKDNGLDGSAAETGKLRLIK